MLEYTILPYAFPKAILIFIYHFAESMLLVRLPFTFILILIDIYIGAVALEQSIFEAAHIWSLFMFSPSHMPLSMELIFNEISFVILEIFMETILTYSMEFIVLELTFVYHVYLDGIRRGPLFFHSQSDLCRTSAYCSAKGLNRVVSHL